MKRKREEPCPRILALLEEANRGKEWVTDLKLEIHAFTSCRWMGGILNPECFITALHSLERRLPRDSELFSIEARAVRKKYLLMRRTQICPDVLQHIFLLYRDTLLWHMDMLNYEDVASLVQ